MPGQPKHTRTVSVSVEITEPDVGPVNVARYILAPADLTDGDRAALLADIKGRAIIKVIQDEAGDLQVTVTPADDAEFEVVQDTPEDLQVTVTPADEAEFTVVQNTPEDLQAEVTPAADAVFTVTQDVAAAPPDPGEVIVNTTVTWNPSASPAEFTVKDWNRGFELGNLDEWTAVEAEISEETPHAGDYCCRLKATASSITQTLDEPVPVNALYEFSAWFKRKTDSDAFTLRMIHTDDTVNDVSGSLTDTGWNRFYFERALMRGDKILSGIAVISYDGDFYVDDIFLGLATEIVAGAVDVLQAIPRSLQAEAIARPKGQVRVKNNITTGAAYAVVAEYQVLDTWKLELAKILVSCPEDVMYVLRWNGTAISAEVYVTGGIPFTDWFPWEYATMWGDGTKKFDIQVKHPAGGTPADCHAEIVGEYVKHAFNT